MGAELLPERIGDTPIRQLVDAEPLGSLRVDLYEFIWAIDGEPPEVQRVDHLEDGGVGADAQRQRGDRHRRESGALSQDAHAVPRVTQQIVERRKTALVAQRL